VSDEVYTEASAEFSEKEFDLPDLGDYHDQCVESLRRGLSLVAAGTAEGAAS
jgi:hypothetical protein